MKFKLLCSSSIAISICWLVAGLFGYATVSLAGESTQNVDGVPSARCGTDWMHRRAIGLSTHYFPYTTDSMEKIANEFQADTVANQAAEVGAGWFLFTVQHQNWILMAPNGAFDRIVGNSGNTPDRDVPLELYRTLAPKGIKLMLYVNLYMNANPAVVRAMGGWPPNDTLIENIAAVYKEYSLRYGDKVAGWWVDGAGMPPYRNSPNRERWFTAIANALRAGNPSALVAISPALETGRYTVNSDFTAGESNDLKATPTSRWSDGAQWHSWTYLGGWWSSDGTRFTNMELGDYVSRVTSKGGAQTFDVGTLGVNQVGMAGQSVPTRHAGSIDAAQIEQIKAIRKSIHPATSARPVHCK